MQYYWHAEAQFLKRNRHNETKSHKLKCKIEVGFTDVRITLSKKIIVICSAS